MTSEAELTLLWDTLGDIPTDQDECIELPFLHFPIGTDLFTIWHWIEETYNVYVYDLLYGGE